MKQKALEYYLGLEWHPVIDTVTDGDDVFVRLAIPGLADFAVYGDSVTEVKEGWREALESHLAGYLTCGKFIPEPVELDVVADPADGTVAGADATVLPGRPLQIA
jgi:hypothetical protein